jgi:hypothetical protein
MTGYIVLGIFTFWVFSVFGAFLFGYTKGRAKERNEQKDEALRKAASGRAFEAQKENIRQEVFGNAEKEKAKLSGGSGRTHFDAINSGLRNKN